MVEPASENPDVIFRRLEGESVLVHLPSDRIFVLNDTAARIWELLQETDDDVAIRRRLAAEFEADPAVIEAELGAFRAELEALRLGDDAPR